jgi:hypothetical protein
MVQPLIGRESPVFIDRRGRALSGRIIELRDSDISETEESGRVLANFSAAKECHYREDRQSNRLAESQHPRIH